MSNNCNEFVPTFDGRCKLLSKIPCRLFFTFNENDFVQSGLSRMQNETFVMQEALHKLLQSSREFTQNKCRQQQSRSLSNHQRCVKFDRLCTVFMKLIDPLYVTNDADTHETFHKLVDKYNQLLKTITCKHKQLLSRIHHYTDTTCNAPDTSYNDKDYLMFWSKLLNTDIYIVCDGIYDEYTHTSSIKFIVIKVYVSSKRLFELVDCNGSTDFETFNKQHHFKRRVDIKKISTMKKNELQSICDDYDIVYNSTMNKQTLIDLIKETI
jgi:hypothetical protein